jgi:hypothetical protein
MSDISAFESERKKRSMSVNEFYAIPREPPSASALPIFDEGHIRAAMARFNQTSMNDSEKKSAYTKIVRAASKFGINSGGFKTSVELGAERPKERECRYEGMSLVDDEREDRWVY